jgi:hypothetical protein
MTVGEPGDDLTVRVSPTTPTPSSPNPRTRAFDVSGGAGAVDVGVPLGDVADLRGRVGVGAVPGAGVALPVGELGVGTAVGA